MKPDPSLRSPRVLTRLPSERTPTWLLLLQAVAAGCWPLRCPRVRRQHSTVWTADLGSA